MSDTNILNVMDWSCTMTFDPTDDWQPAISTEEGDDEEHPWWRPRPAEDQHLHRALLPLSGGECLDFVHKRGQYTAQLTHIWLSEPDLAWTMKAYSKTLLLLSFLSYDLIEIKATSVIISDGFILTSQGIQSQNCLLVLISWTALKS